jgi:Protein of unknown function (DUF3592)
MRLLAAVAVIALSGFSIVVLLREMLRGVRSRHWPDVPGTIVRSDVVTIRDADGDAYKARITYRYRVGDSDYEGERIRFGGPFDSSFRRWAVQICDDYAVGTSVRVRVSPHDVRASVLEPGIRWPLLFVMAFFVSLWLLGVWLLLQELRWIGPQA